MSGGKRRLSHLQRCRLLYHKASNWTSIVDARVRSSWAVYRGHPSPPTTRQDVGAVIKPLGLRRPLPVIMRLLAVVVSLCAIFATGRAARVVCYWDGKSFWREGESRN
ncbi:hypothetical protein J6590_023542 [Homalodisca vitripennis]|nr:hypothetical protein J6590_023542 [Homalodisca vitripennis]